MYGEAWEGEGGRGGAEGMVVVVVALPRCVRSSSPNYNKCTHGVADTLHKYMVKTIFSFFYVSFL